MDVSKGFAGVTLCWLYEQISKRGREAFLNSHPKFIAARKIQALVRGYQIRCMIENWNQKALIIQRNWRGYIARVKYLEFLKELYLEKMQEHYDRCATKIQSLYRGYYSRMNIHDHTKMKLHQREAAKDLIVCIGHRLHYLLRTQHIPGVYSIRNSNCLSKVEKLLTLLKFKDYNHNVRQLRDEQLVRIRCALDENKQKTRGAEKYPYGRTTCDHLRYKCMNKVLNKFQTGTYSQVDELIDNSTRKYPTNHKKKSKDLTAVQQQSNHLFRYYNNDKIKPQTFPKNDNYSDAKSCTNICSEVLNSMTKWGIIQNDRNFIVSPSIVQNTDCIEGFVGDVNTLWHRH